MADLETPLHATATPAADVAFAKHARALRSYLVRRLYAPREAADLAQEIFTRFLRKKDRPEVIRKPLAFLFGIASNVLREHFDGQRTELVEFDSELADAAAESGAPDAHDGLAEQIGLQGDLEKALASLPPNHLIAVLLIKGEGLSIAEAARRTGFTEGTLTVYLSEARWKLKRMLQDYASKADLS